MSININTSFSESFIDKTNLKTVQSKALASLKLLKEKKGEGHEFLGWLDLPNHTKDSDLDDVLKVADSLQQYETVVVVGIGGSYLGAKALVDLFKPYFSKETTELLFAGQNLDDEYLSELLAYLDNRNFAVIVISKSGTTLEPAIAFRLLYQKQIEKYGLLGLKERIVVITDKEKGALRELVNKHALKSFIVPDNVGGRFSVLTAVGLLPIAVAGIDIKELISGAGKASVEFQKETIDNPAIRYAVYRNLLYQESFSNEIMVYSKPKWNAFAEWWKQLFGESEGKDLKGIFPVSMNITTDLHSLGQYIQEGEKKFFETFIRFTSSEINLEVNKSAENYDKLDYLEGKSIYYINSKAEEGAMKAHFSGSVPVIEIELTKLDISSVGELIYFYEISCAISAYVLGVNPFNQPGVEAYKTNMLALLGQE